MANKYRFERLTDAAAFPAMDGIAFDSVNGVIVAAGGWTNLISPTVRNTIYESSTGTSWTAKPNAPWTGRHTMGHGVKSNGWVYYWGSDIFSAVGAGNPRREVWRYNQATGVHELVTAEWGSALGDRVLFSSCVHNDYLYAMTGQNGTDSSATMYIDMYRSADGVTWTKVCDVPVGMRNRSMGALISAGTKMFFGGGAKYDDAGNTNYGDDLWESTDNGVTWTQVIASSPHLKGIYSCGAFWDGKVWFMKGFHDGKNRPGIVSIDPVTYAMKTIPYNLSGRHAQACCVHDDGLVIGAGSTEMAIMNDVWKLVRL